MFKKSFTLFVLAASLMLLVACGGAEEENAPIKIGAIHDLSGPTSDIGTPYANGIRDYVKFLNENGGVAGREIDLLSQDYAYAVDQAESLYSQFVNEGAVAFQGWGTGDTEALKARIASDEIPFMSASLSETLSHPDEAPYNFLVGTTYSDQFIILMKYLKEQGIDKVAIMHHDSPFGTSPIADGEDWAAANGVEVIALPMPGGATDFTAELTQVQESGAGAIVIQNVPSPASTLAKDIERLGMDIQLACLNYCSNELFVELSGSASEGSIAANPFAFPGSGNALETEIRGYTDANDKNLDELGVGYVQGWATMKAMADAIEDVIEAGDEVTGPNIHAALESFSNHDLGGVSDPLNFSSTNHKGNDALVLYQVVDGVHVAISDFISAQ